MKTIQVGIPHIYGAQPVKPIWNIPADAKRVRLRLRNNDYARAFVLFSDRIEQWTVGPRGQMNSPQWELKLLQAVNHKCKQP